MGKPKKASPSQRLAAQRPIAESAAAQVAASDVAPDVAAAPVEIAQDAALMAALAEKPAPMRLRSKWLVVEKREAPEMVEGQLVTRWLVHLKAVYEPLSILHGQATVQGCADNRMFGTGMPVADQVMTLASKAIADSYVVGRAYLQDHVEVLPDLRALS